MSVLDNLNEMQRIAAEKVDGPSLILAGAGSGKTRTITYKIAYMIKEKNISPNNIVALTFTNKAANEMKERILSLVGVEAKSMVISTFHSFSVMLLRNYGNRIGIDYNFNIYDVDDSKSLIKKIIKNYDNTISFTPAQIYTRISKNKEKCIGYKEFEKTVDMNILDNKIFFEIFKEYQEQMINNNCMDFSDILLNCKILLENKEVLDIVQNKYRYILVDEYQDTNDIQYDIVHNISKKYNNICVVGDEDQSIYAFRGANIQNILNFEKDHKNSLVVKLEENYRSTPNILNVANSVIKNNNSSLGKKLWTKNKEGKNINVYRAETPYDEARFIAESIKFSNKDFKDFTILYRTNYQSRILEQELNRYGVNCKVFGGLSFYQRKEIKDLLSYLLLLNNPNDIISFERAITNPKRKIGEKTIQKIVNTANKMNINCINALAYESSKKILEFYNIYTELFNKINQISISELLKEIIEKTEYMEYLKTLEDSEDRTLNVFELINSIEELEKISPNMTLDEYLTTTSLTSSSDNIDDNNYVKLMTIHSSKGLEFDTVFLVGFENGIFPSFENLQSIVELEEERRLCYVAITRAKKELVITYSSTRNIKGITEFAQSPSKFLKEMDTKYLNFLNDIKIQPEFEKPKISIENFNPIKQPIKKDKYYVGKIVNHISYGQGKIVLSDDKSITIDFSGMKKKIAVILADRFLK